RESIRLDPQFIPAYGNLAAGLMATDRYSEARAVLRQAADRKLAFNGARRLSYFLAFVQGDAATMARELDASLGVGENNAAFGWQARASAFSGRVAMAHERFGRGIQLSLQGKFPEVAAQLTMEDAETHAVVGQCDEARRETAAGLALGRDSATLARASRALALCGDARPALSLTSDVAARFPEATFANGVAVPVTAAALALAQRDPARARALLEPVKRYDHAPSAEFWPAYLRGQAYLDLKDGAAAATEFRSIIDHRGEVPITLLYPLAYLGHARAAAMSRDMESARKSYEAFFALWNGADADIQPLADARLEFSRLETAPRSTFEYPRSNRRLLSWQSAGRDGRDAYVRRSKLRRSKTETRKLADDSSANNASARQYDCVWRPVLPHLSRARARRLWRSLMHQVLRLAACLFVLGIAGAVLSPSVQSSATQVAGKTDRAAASAAHLPSDFIENRGQWRGPETFAARRGGVAVALEPRAIRLRLGTADPAAITLTFEGASPQASLVGEDRRPTLYNFFSGNDPTAWRTGVPGFGSVLYRQVYDGVNIRLHDRSDTLEYDLLLQPGADLRRVVVRVDGASALEMADDGGLVVRTP